MRRFWTLVTLGLLAWGCDDSGGPGTDPTDAAPDGPQVEADMAQPDGDGGVDPRPDAGDFDGATPGDAGPIPDALPPDAPEPDVGLPMLRPRFDPRGDDFYDTPWPADARLTEQGTPNLSLFPGLGDSIQKVIIELESHVFGYATMPIAYFAFNRPLDPLKLPVTAESTAVDSTVQMIALGELCGARVPIEAKLREVGDKYIPEGTLQVKNTVGRVLTPGVPHAVVVLKSIADEDVPGQTPAAFLAAWEGDGSRWAADLQHLKDCPADLALDDILIATVFTPQDPVRETQAMRDRVMDPEQVETRAPSDVIRNGAWSRRRLNITTLSGLVEFPVFQSGETPYNMAGGAFVLDDDGVPTIQRWEPVPFAMAFKTGEFAEPRPALVFIDGTGWQPWRHLRSTWMTDALNAGYVIFSFMPQFHGKRAGVEIGPELLTFNFLNPESGRTNFRQQAVENAFFSRIIREQLAAFDGLPPVDVTRIVYGGHSQGSLAGSLTAAVDDSYAAYVLNGLAAYLTLTILERTDLLNFELVVRNLLENDGPLDLFSPALQLMQLGSEAVDPHNYARLWRGSPGNPGGNHVFVLNGFNDDTTTPRGMDQLTLSADLPVFDAPGWDIDPLGIGLPPLVQLPVQGTTESSTGEPLTIATYLDPLEGHFTIYRQRTLRAMAFDFWADALSGAVPSLIPGQELLCKDGVDGDGNGTTDCEDPTCANREPCVERVCTDERDGDGDDLIDCEDPDCANAFACQEDDCGDGLDEDGDGLTDCDDPGCMNREPCRESACRDFMDGDNDGFTDCADPDCIGTRPCREFSCTDGRDNDGDGREDCDDDECTESLACPEGPCDDGIDNDGDGQIDCADPRCLGTDACPIVGEVECADGLDDDGDGAIDCDDLDCSPFCPNETCAHADLGSALGTPVFVGTLAEVEDTYDPPDCTALGTGDEAPELAFRWTAPADGVYTISTLRSEGDTVLMLLPDDCDALNEIACADDLPGVVQSGVNLEIDEGRSVVIVVAAYEKTAAKPIVLSIFPRAAEE